MKVTKICGLTLVFTFLVAPATVNGRSYEGCLNDYYSAAANVKDVNEVCGLTKTLINCLGSGRSLSYDTREQLKRELESAFTRYNLNCDFSVDALVDNAFSGAKTSSTSLSFLTLILIAFGGFTLVRNLA